MYTTSYYALSRSIKRCLRPRTIEQNVSIFFVFSQNILHGSIEMDFCDKEFHFGGKGKYYFNKKCVCVTSLSMNHDWF